MPGQRRSVGSLATSSSLSAVSPDAGQGESSSNDAECMKATLTAIPGDSADLLSDALLGSGATSVVVVEHRPAGAAEQELFEDGSGTSQLWNLCDIIIYFPIEHEDIPGTVVEALDVVGLICPEAADAILIEPVYNEQWVEQIKASYQPLQISNRLHIVPEWSVPTCTDPNAINIILQPGVAFGTGEHPTTRMCLAALEEAEPQLQGATVLDYGCGSGVLALAALLLGARSAVGTDTDPLAVRSAKRNAELNSQEAFTALLCGPSLDDPEPLQQGGYPCNPTFDVVAANILRGPLLELQPRLTQYCRPGGLLLLSGILAEQVPDIRAVYEPHFTDFTVRTEGTAATWACITAIRKDSMSV